MAWAPGKRRAIIEYGVFEGHISEEKSRKKLDGLLKNGFKNAYGRKVEIDLLAIDGNAYTDDVWEWAKKHPASRVIMVRGRHEEHVPLLKRVQREHDKRGKALKYSRRFYNFASAILKMSLYRNVRKEDPAEKGHVLFPRGLDDEFYRQFTAETRKAQRQKHGFLKYLWVKDPNQANEALDTHLQAETAFIRKAGTQRELLDSEWDALFAERERAPEEEQGDFEDLLLGGGLAPPVEEPKPTETVKEADTAQLRNKWRNRTR